MLILQSWISLVLKTPFSSLIHLSISNWALIKLCLARKSSLEIKFHRLAILSIGSIWVEPCICIGQLVHFTGELRCKVVGIVFAYWVFANTKACACVGLYGVRKRSPQRSSGVLVLLTKNDIGPFDAHNGVVFVSWKVFERQRVGGSHCLLGAIVSKVSEVMSLLARAIASLILV